MAGLAVPLLEGAVQELGPILARSGAALLGGAAAAGTASLPGSAAKDDSKATPAARTVPNTTQSCKKCPPDTGFRHKRKHGVNWNAYRYQNRITGFPFDEENCRWSEEWKWLGIDFDGFEASACLLQEAKGNYDQFLDGSIPKADKWFAGFDTMQQQIIDQGSVVRANPPARLIWYFQTPLTQKKMAPVLARMGVQSVLQP
ncbi:restriction endonuclease fold toxin 5 domain-containing protein [Paraburkholderia tropica]|uniref:restriction endonuclease fold toxin 5 domain-containing protein n=1 Tax=Paraburkholderia tropica TaxID=92647 RepID=UPI002AB10BB7|nr:restriction endonuclease fold toxin 5 domain-containing protein [Paraburkholderia tropica]